MELSIDGDGGCPVVLKELTRHPLSGETTHIDLLRVRLDRAITATVVVELLGGEDAPGVKEGGVLEQVAREVEVEALPNDIPDVLEHDVSEVQIGDTVTVGSVETPSGVTIVTDAEAVLATVTPPRLQVEAEEEIEEETELVAEGATEEEAEQAEGSGQEPGGEGEGE